MRRTKRRLIFYAAVLLTLITVPVLSAWALSTDTPTSVLSSVSVNPEMAGQGYTLIAPINSKMTYLIDNDGQQVHSWESDYYPGVEVSLQENGQLLRATQITPTDFDMGGAGGGVELLNWDGSVDWSYEYTSDEYIQHHDAQVMPDGSIIMLAWDLVTSDEALAAGVDPVNIDAESDSTWAESIIEVDPQSNEIVWEWHTWDHLIQDYDDTKANFGVVEDNSELINANYYEYSQKPDWMHANSIDYNPETDQILISAREFNEIWVIDHSTSTEQAATHTEGESGMGGDLLYRWGNPEAYDSGTVADRELYMQHNANWIDEGLEGAGEIIIFSNGDESRPYSTIEQITPPLDDITYGDPSETIISWNYTAPTETDFYGSYLGGVQRLENGNTLITQGPAGKVFEVNASGDIVWSFTNPISMPSLQDPTTESIDVFRAYRYPLDYPGLIDKDLDPQGNITSDLQ